MYFTTFGQDTHEPLTENYDDAITWLKLTINDLERDHFLPHWQAEALRQQADNMPRAGTSFQVPRVGLVKVEKGAWPG